MGVVRFLAAAVTAGAAWLGLGLVLSDDDPLARLGALATVVTLLGGWASSATTVPAVLRLLTCLGVSGLTRVAAGPIPALFVAILIALGWALRLRLRDAVVALATVGVGIGLVSRSSWRLLAAFFLLGLASVGVARLASMMRRQRVASYKPETHAAASLTSESLAVRVRSRFGRISLRKALAGRLQS